MSATTKNKTIKSKTAKSFDELLENNSSIVKDAMDTLLPLAISETVAQTLASPEYVTRIGMLIEQEAKKLSDVYLAHEISELFKQATDTMLLKMLGFSKDSWGNTKWEIDHCNGRAGSSPIGIFTKGKSSAIASELLTKYFDITDFKTKLASSAELKKCVASFEKEMAQRVIKELKDQQYSMVRDIVEETQITINDTMRERVANTFKAIDAAKKKTSAIKKSSSKKV